MDEKFIADKLVDIDNQLQLIKQTLTDMNSDASTTVELQRQLAEANKRIRCLEYENFILKNPNKVSTTTNIKENEQ